MIDISLFDILRATSNDGIYFPRLVLMEEISRLLVIPMNVVNDHLISFKELKKDHINYLLFHFKPSKCSPFPYKGSKKITVDVDKLLLH
jgi:hypothetical protein